MAETISIRRDIKPSLVFLSGELIAVPIPLERENVTLGRALEADVRVNDAQVSRRHAQVVVEDGQYILIDLDSRNGTFLNGARISRQALENGDKISIGETMLRFDLLDAIDREYQRQIHRLISHDDLTGLLSSRSFFSELRREAGRAAQEDRPFCVLMMDGDNFKSVNDTFGHLTGSKTIEEIGLSIMKNLRSGDAAARFGGDEFAAFLLDADIGQGLIAAERIRRSVSEYPFSVLKQGKKGETHHITVSIGLACFPSDSSDPIELVEMADSALYRAKRSGRDCVAAYRDVTDQELRGPFRQRRS
jgi:diguanylate cyclase (GGDEF)-like protein